jgi:hypothetical protein
VVVATCFVLASFFIIEVGVFDVGCDCFHVLGKVLARVSVI